jgi:hypothetical protein
MSSRNWLVLMASSTDLNQQVRWSYDRQKRASIGLEVNK